MFQIIKNKKFKETKHGPKSLWKKLYIKLFEN